MTDTYAAYTAKRREMESLSAAELEARCEEMSRRKREIEHEEMDLIRALDEARKREERKRPDTLTKEDERRLRRDLTLVGEQLERSMFGGFQLADEEPEEKDPDEERPESYSLKVEVQLTDLFGTPEWCTKATLSTKNAVVRAIVREMITETRPDSRDAHLEKTYWGIDWDGDNSIKVKNPMSEEEFRAKEKA